MKHQMKYLQSYRVFESATVLTKDQINWLNYSSSGGSWELNPVTGLVDVKGNFDCSNQGLYDFKGVRFGVVTGIGGFNCNSIFVLVLLSC